MAVFDLTVVIKALSRQLRDGPEATRSNPNFLYRIRVEPG
jgi:hypothetical protein